MTLDHALDHSAGAASDTQSCGFTYDATGSMVAITWTAYDALNQVVAQGDFQLNAAGTARTVQAQQTYVLNSDGDRIQVTDALGHTAYYDYDSQHRVIASQTPIQHASGWSDTVSYDANGHKTGETTANGDHQSWVVDYYGRVQSHVDLSGALTTYAYDAGSGLLVTTTSHWTPAGQTNPGYLDASLDGSSSTQTYSYDADGQIAQLTDRVAGTVVGWDTYQYDANGNTTNDTHWGVDGAGQAVNVATLSQYDSHDRLSVVTTQDTATHAITAREAFTYDAAGNRRAVYVQSAYGPGATAIGGNGGAPTAAAIAAQTAQPGKAWLFASASGFTDNVGFGLTYAASQANGSALPSWLGFNPANGTFSGTPTTAGSWSLTVTATDVTGRSVSTTFTLTVAAPPPSPQPPQYVGTLQSVDYSYVSKQAVAIDATGQFRDPQGGALTYTASQSGGAALPAWLSFNPATQQFTVSRPLSE